MTILKVAMGIFFAVMLVDAHVPAATSTSTSTSTSEVEKLIASLSYCSGAESPLLRTVKGSPLLSCRRSSTSFTLFVLLSNKQSDSIERCLWYPITMATPIVGKMLELDKIYSTLIYIYDLGAFGLNLSSSYGGTLVCCSTFLNWFIARQEFPSSSDCQSNCKPPYRSRSSSGNSSSFVASPAELNNFLASFRESEAKRAERFLSQQVTTQQDLLRALGELASSVSPSPSGTVVFAVFLCQTFLLGCALLVLRRLVDPCLSRIGAVLFPQPASVPVETLAAAADAAATEPSTAPSVTLQLDANSTESADDDASQLQCHL